MTETIKDIIMKVLLREIEEDPSGKLRNLTQAGGLKAIFEKSDAHQG